MPQIGPLEILVVSVIALIVFGPRRLPEIARQIGRTLTDVRRQLSEIKSEFDLSLEDEEERVPGTPSGQKSTSAATPETAPATGEATESLPADPEPALLSEEELTDAPTAESGPATEPFDETGFDERDERGEN